MFSSVAQWLVIIPRYDMIRCMTNYDYVTTAGV